MEKDTFSNGLIVITIGTYELIAGQTGHDVSRASVTITPDLVRLAPLGTHIIPSIRQPKKSYRAKMLLIDQLIHSFHIDKKGDPVKSVASKLLEGNKKDVVRFLDNLSPFDSEAVNHWRSEMSKTIDARIVKDGI